MLVGIPVDNLFSYAGGIEGREVRILHVFTVLILTRYLFHLKGNVRLYTAV